MTNYNLVFLSFYDTTYTMYFGLLVLIVGTIYLIINFHKVEKEVIKIYYKVFLVFLFMLLYSAYHNMEIRDKVKTTIKTKTYKTIKGKIKNFYAMPKVGHDTERFDVNNVHFKILYTGNNPDDKTLFYTLTKNRNGPIQRNGQKVKIHYITINGENEIIKMWVYEP